MVELFNLLFSINAIGSAITVHCPFGMYDIVKLTRIRNSKCDLLNEYIYFRLWNWNIMSILFELYLNFKIK